MRSIVVALSVLLFSCVSFAQSAQCISKGMASNLVAKQFLNEYFGRVNTSIFDDTFGNYFYHGSFNENVQGVKDAFLTDDYRFDGLNHVFESKHIFRSGDDSTYIEFAEFEVVVSCLNNNKITADSTTDGYEDY